ncbi:thiaminase II [Chryseolinea lacunae]|uniref:Aminopyrimidine aminohydrolase n=1 Tax=Chryseolinea lacunae TaxID=2801331 RepID=A0ABS1KLM0_9BACT|nr:thiaminase II [Chryseolinea lacunae]MBL0740350.1 thiaminase II [Chryseolinea lacunae]
MTWSVSAWKTAEPIYAAITRMPFIEELMAGSLAQEKFKFYIAQDSHYLEHFGRTLSLIASRAHGKDTVLEFIRFAEGALVVESALHAGYFEQLGIADKPAVSPSCHHYNAFLYSTAAQAQVETAMAAVLPCFWIYKAVGDHILQHQNKNGNPYQQWIDTYGGEAFGVLVQKAIRMCDEAAETCTPAQRDAMTEAFVTACRLEWLFWDSAWRLEHWSV